MFSINLFPNLVRDKEGKPDLFRLVVILLLATNVILSALQFFSESPIDAAYYAERAYDSASDAAANAEDCVTQAKKAASNASDATNAANEAADAASEAADNSASARDYAYRCQ